MTEQPIIYSRLAKAAFLVGNSAVFPQLVMAACAHHGIPFEQDATNFVATRPEILDALEMREDQPLDNVLQGFARDPNSAGALDGMILAAVQQYKQQGAN